MIKFKHEELYSQIVSNKVRPEIRMLAVATASRLGGLDVVVTGVLGEKGIKRKSKTHEEGRAIDIRTKDWSDGFAQQVEMWLNATFSTGAEFDDGRAMNVCVYHDSGYGRHLHIQVARRPLIIKTHAGDILL